MLGESIGSGGGTSKDSRKLLPDYIGPLVYTLALLLTHPSLGVLFSKTTCTYLCTKHSHHDPQDKRPKLCSSRSKQSPFLQSLVPDPNTTPWIDF